MSFHEANHLLIYLFFTPKKLDFLYNIPYVALIVTWLCMYRLCFKP